MRTERGISLIEIIVAVAIIAVVMLFLSRGFITSMYMTRQSDEYSAAARAAREKMEEIVSFTIRQYDRKESPATQWTLQNDPQTGQYKVKLAPMSFLELPAILRTEFVGGRRLGNVVTIPSSQTIKSPETSGFDLDPFGRLHPFKVYLTDYEPDNPDSTRGLLPGLVDDYAGEVIVIVSEQLENFAANTRVPINTANNNHVRGVGSYGGDLFPRDGTPDGFEFFRLPLDLNCNGAIGENKDDLASTQRRFPVGVIIRWQGRYGPERHETWTIISQW